MVFLMEGPGAVAVDLFAFDEGREIVTRAGGGTRRDVQKAYMACLFAFATSPLSPPTHTLLCP